MTAAFLEAAGWGKAGCTPLAGDASARRYARLHLGRQRAILMRAAVDGPGDRNGFAAFRRIGAHLRRLGLSAPEEIAADPENGLILMEDLGDVTLSRLLADDPRTAELAYRATAAMLDRLDAPPPPGLATPDAEGMARMAGLTFDLLPGSDPLRARLMPLLAEALAAHASGPPVLALRDVHGDNLIWLPDRTGDGRIGLLDYQDAMMLPRGYDLASLLDDVRRDVPSSWRDSLVGEFATSKPGFDILSLQRNLRILGVFRRLSVGFGKPAYAAFLPRTRALIARAAESQTAPLAMAVAELLDRTAEWDLP